MYVEVIKTQERFVSVKDDWEAVYAADPDAQFFLSWTWLSAWLKDMQTWGVLAARPEASLPPVGFFPIRLRVTPTPAGGRSKEVAMAGNRGADYTGFICRPEYDDEVIPAFAAYIKKISWDSLHLENICMSPKRIEHFLSCFPTEKYHYKVIKVFNKGENIDNYICPYVPLPATWSSYLSDNLKANTRHNVRRYLGRVEKSSDMAITHADKNTADRDINILFDFWVLKWQEKKPKNITVIRNSFQKLFRDLLEKKSLFLPVLWNGQKPIGAVASFLDTKNKSLLVYMQGRDENYNNPPPGFVLHAYGIQWAINNGFRTYDFLRGNESYKYLFRPKERQIWYLVISVKSASAPGVDVRRSHAQAAGAPQLA